MPHYLRRTIGCFTAFDVRYALDIKRSALFDRCSALDVFAKANILEKELIKQERVTRRDNALLFVSTTFAAGKHYECEAHIEYCGTIHIERIAHIEERAPRTTVLNALSL